MKTLCSTLGLLLLLIACCYAAMPEGPQLSTAPRSCCFNFQKHRLPVKRVSDITKTDSSCQRKAFVVLTIRGQKVCYSQTSKWVLKLYNKLHTTEGSGLQL